MLLRLLVCKLGLFCVKSLSYLSFTKALFLSKPFGRMIMILARHRRRVCTRNIQACFPELTEKERRELVLKSFDAAAMGIFETSWAWYRSEKFFDTECRLFVENPEILNRALQKGRGVLLVGAHYSMLDLIVPMVFRLIGRFSVSYRPHENPCFESEIQKCRSRYVDLVNVRSTRDIVRRLRDGGLVWFAYDQDLGLKGSVFAPFFENLAATVITPARIVETTQCTPVFLSCSRAGREYRLRFNEFPDWYPSCDQTRNATTINKFVEKALEIAPEQYMWMHRRFKTRPEHESRNFYD